MRTRASWASAFALVLPFLGSAPAAPDPPIRVLLLSGSNNHDWQATTPVLRDILQGGRFEVEVTERPQDLSAERLQPYDVVVSNWNSYNNPDVEAAWSPETRQALLDFVRRGRGHVTVHAGSSSFDDWPEYFALTLAHWGEGQTRHGPVHAFAVRIADREHPITRGLEGFQITDELWDRPAVHEEALVLAESFSDRQSGGEGTYEPSVLVRAYGEGHSFTLLLGHNATAMQTPGFQQLLRRGTEWAATGNVSEEPPGATPPSRREELIGAVSRWEYGTDRRPVTELQAAVQASASDPIERSAWAQALTDALQAPGTPDGRRALCEPLGWVGGDPAVRVLAGLLMDETVSLAVRDALEAIGSPEARRALREAAPEVPYPQRAGLLLSLGRLGDPEALDLFAEEWTRGPAAARAAALEAIGFMHEPAACQRLEDWEPDVPADLRNVWGDVMVGCLEATAPSQAPAASGALLERLSGPPYANHIRRSALVLLVSSAPPQERAAVLLVHLATGDEPLRQAALEAIRKAGDAEELNDALAPSLASLPAPVQRDVIPLLARTPSTAVLKSLHEALETEDPTLRATAAVALGRSTNTQSARALLDRLAQENDEDVRPALVAGLSRIAAPGVDELLVEALAETDAVPREELISILVARQAVEAVPALVQMATDDDPRVQAEAIQAVGELGGPQAGRDLVRLLGGPSTAAQRAIPSSLIRIARRLEPPGVDWLLTDWERYSAEVQARLMPVLSAVGGEKALSAARAGLAAPSLEVHGAALRALCDWPDPAPTPDLLQEAEAPREEQEAWLALAGVARLLGAEGTEPVEGFETDWRQALTLASRPEERKALLGTLARRPHVGLRDDVGPLLSDPLLTEEAALALAAMARQQETPPAVQLELWHAVLASTASDAVRDEALQALVGAGREVPLTTPSGARVQWRRGDERVALVQDGGVLWAFEFGPQRTKPFFHPLALPGTPPITALSPEDHPWHYGLWFSWKYINEVNYWEEDRETGLAAGTTSWKPPEVSLRHDGSARFELDLTYLPAGGHPVLREARTIEVSPPQADGAYALDWTLTFTALTDVVLDRTPLPTEPEGKTWGGYAGLSARLSTALTDRGTALTNEPPPWTDDRIRHEAEAMEYHGLVDGHPLGLAILDHPDNLNAPTPWYAIRSPVMSFFTPAVICFGAHSMKAGESLTLKYRVWVHPGAWDREQLQQAHREYADD